MPLCSWDLTRCPSQRQINIRLRGLLALFQKTMQQNGVLRMDTKNHPSNASTR